MLEIKTVASTGWRPASYARATGYTYSTDDAAASTNCLVLPLVLCCVIWGKHEWGPAAHLSAEAKDSLPQHVAVIMDGNGRWAQRAICRAWRGIARAPNPARVIIRTAGELGIKYLTLYAFSAENWNPARRMKWTR